MTQYEFPKAAGICQRNKIEHSNMKLATSMKSAIGKQVLSTLWLVAAMSLAILSPVNAMAQNASEEMSSDNGHAHHKKQGDPEDTKPQYRWTQSSDDGRVNIAIFPKGGSLIFNDFHTWVVELTDDQGRPITDAQIAIDGGMKGHGHGLPSRPLVGGQLGGQYLIEGMLFNMSGDWTLAFKVSTSIAQNIFVFPITLSH